MTPQEQEELSTADRKRTRTAAFVSFTRLPGPVKKQKKTVMSSKEWANSISFKPKLITQKGETAPIYAVKQDPTT